MSKHSETPEFVVAGAMNWHLDKTAKGLEARDGLVGFWSSIGNKIGVSDHVYRRIWPYHVVKLPFYFWASENLEELMRWKATPFYDAWMKFQSLPASCNAVLGPMGSCETLFDLADKASQRVLKVFDAPNSHPNWLIPKWQKECDEFFPGYTIPLPKSMGERIAREIERADIILCPSNFVRDSMVANGVPEDKCFINHFGVDTSIFKAREVVPKNPVFVTVGSVCLRKGHQYLFRAFEQVREKFREARLICIGGSRHDFKKEEPRWKELAEFHTQVPHSEIAKILMGATAFVLPSVEEGFARVLSEAMGAALPIIATYETGATTVINHEQEGLIVPARDIEALAEAMIRLASDPEMNLAMGQKAFVAGGVDNSWDDYASRIYERVATGLLSPTK